MTFFVHTFFKIIIQKNYTILDFPGTDAEARYQGESEMRFIFSIFFYLHFSQLNIS